MWFWVYKKNVYHKVIKIHVKSVYIPQKVLDLNQNCISARSALLEAAYFKTLLYFVSKRFEVFSQYR